MPDKVKLRPMAEAPKEPVDQDGSGPCVLLWDESRPATLYVGCWRETFAVWMVDSTYCMDIKNPVGWLPIPEVEA